MNGPTTLPDGGDRSFCVSKSKNYRKSTLQTPPDLDFAKEIDQKFRKIFKTHPRLGILSACASDWGENILLKKKKLLYFWYMENHAIVLRKNFILDIINTKKPGYINFLYDGNNFRGYGTESELIAKAYSNFWGAAITSDVRIDENESYLIKKSNLIKYHLCFFYFFLSLTPKVETLFSGLIILVHDFAFLLLLYL